MKMSCLVLIIVFSFLFTCDCFFWPTNQIKTCIPNYHAWQPFFGVIPPNAYLAGVDLGGEKKFVARVVSPDKRSWSAPTTLPEKTLKLYYNWGTKLQSADKFAEVLVINPKNHAGFGFRETSKYNLKTLSEECCLVEGGSGYVSGEKYISWVGRVMVNGKYYIGGVREAEWSFFYVLHPMIYLDNQGINRGVSWSFEVLTYDCCTKSHCLNPNKADCCFDILQ